MKLDLYLTDLDEAFGNSIHESGTKSGHEARSGLTLEASFAALPQELSQELSENERDRAASFFDPVKRSRFIRSRIFMRRSLAKILNCKPSEVAFDVGSNGKPCLKAPHSKILFSLSHSRQMCALAVADCKHFDSPPGSSNGLGCDIEYVDPSRSFRKLGSRFFSSEELAWIYSTGESSPPSAPQSRDSDPVARRFYQLWTAKEAIIKAHGLALVEVLAEVRVSPVYGTRGIAILRGVPTSYHWMKGRIEGASQGEDAPALLPESLRNFQICVALAQTVSMPPQISTHWLNSIAS